MRCPGRKVGVVDSVYETAKEIYQQHLDGVDDAIMQRDFEKYASFFAPQHIYKTENDLVQITDLVELRMVFDIMCGLIERHGVPTLDRVCTCAEFFGPNILNGKHQTRLVRRDAIVAEFYTAQSKLTMVGGSWRLSHIEFTESTSVLPTSILAHYHMHKHRNG